MASPQIIPRFLRKSGILFTTMLAMMSFTVITPFYSAIAVRQGIPESLIGYIFSAFPIASFIISFILPKIMIIIGRTPVYIFGMCLLAFSNLTISNLPYIYGHWAIFLSFISRISSGLGSACETISSYAILTSDYPEDINQLISFIEIIGGLGAILGPTVGSMLFALSGFTNSCFYVGLGILIWIPGIYYIIGPSRPYVISTDKISLKKIWTKPKILLDSFMQFLVMFTVGYMLPNIEFHLLSFGVPEENIGLWFNIYTFGYIFGSTIVPFLPKSIDKTNVMIFGLFTITLAYLLLGPCPWIFPKNFGIVCVGLALTGLSLGLIYVPSLPHMIEMGYMEYGFKKDDRLNDTLSEITNISLCVGEIVGPIAGAYMPLILGYEYASTVLAVVYFAYACVYLAFRCKKPLDIGIKDKELDSDVFETEKSSLELVNM
ncbi:hypothetical protein SteCoe_3317 [Stentor coeruleus]|uniref:Major facilitator superfamily (MFS) profile domain-containing protein n=1 Tax=Stentor coeruleus TaxID=5963 RepID=A0A1R2CXC2_9CILI|nr:hypothetical protein SteCoe_3317 [Stentor coeruleus]